MKIEKKPGIYQIKSKKTGTILVTGAAYNCEAKFDTIYNALKRNMHPSKILRKACSEHGIKDLSFEVLEYCKMVEIGNVLKKHLSGAAESSAPVEKKVKQIDLDGKVVKEWPSAAVAAVELELRENRIKAVCKGKAKSHGGFEWKYGGKKRSTKKSAAKPVEKPAESIDPGKEKEPTAEKPKDPGEDFR